MLRGEIVHAALERFFKEGRPEAPAPVFDGIWREKTRGFRALLKDEAQRRWMRSAFLRAAEEMRALPVERVEQTFAVRVGDVLLTGRIDRVVRRFTQGLATVRQPRRLLTALLWSLPLWLLLAAGIWLTARAFHMTVPYTGSFLIVAFLVVGVSVPTPGAVGGFHAAFQVAVTRFYGVPNDRAVGAAIVLHALSFLPVALLGAAFMLHDGLSLARVRALASGGMGDDSAPLTRDEPTGAPAEDDPAVRPVGEAGGVR
jgi:hypothetical protein